MSKPEILKSYFNKKTKEEMLEFELDNANSIIKELQTDLKVSEEKRKDLLIDLERLLNEYA